MKMNVRSHRLPPGKCHLPLVAAGFLILFSSIASAQPVYKWAKNINGAGAWHHIARDEKGNIYLSGVFGGSSDFDPGPKSAVLTTGESDYYVAKYDPEGNYLFAFPIPVDHEASIEIAVDHASNIYVTGSLDITSESKSVDFDPGFGQAFLSTKDGSCFVAKYDSSGNYLWAFTIDSLDYDTYWPRDMMRHITVDNAGNIYLTGHFFGSTDFDPGPNETVLKSDSSDAFLAKYDTQGNYLWARKAGGKGSDGAIGIALDNSGNAYITGWSDGHAIFDPKNESGFLSDVGPDFFFAKYDSSGAYQWVKSIVTPFFLGGSIGLDSSGNIYTIIDCDSTVDVDPGFGTFHLPGYGYCLAKYSSDGKFIWARSIGINANVYDLQVGISNSVYITGILYRTNSFDPGNDLSTMTANCPNADMFIAKYDPNSAFAWAMHIGPHDSVVYVSLCVPGGMVLDASENMYVSGRFGSKTDFDPGAGIAELTSFPSQDIFFAKYSQVKSSVEHKLSEPSALFAYPNPANNQVHLQGHLAMPEKAEVTMYNILGAEVLRQSFDAQGGFSLPLDISKLQEGLYSVTIQLSEGIQHLQLIKE